MSHQSHNDGVELARGVMSGVALELAVAGLILLFCHMAGAETLPNAPQPALKQPFLSSRVNRSLVAAEFTTRLLDAISTEQFIHNPCHCFHEAGSFAFAAQHAPLQYGYSLGVAAGYTMLSKELWKHGHRKLARGVLMFDIAYDAKVGVVNNEMLVRRKK
jgi:hypothetical protein